MMHLGLCAINYALAVVHFFPTRKKKTNNQRILEQHSSVSVRRRRSTCRHTLVDCRSCGCHAFENAKLH